MISLRLPTVNLVRQEYALRRRRRCSFDIIMPHIRRKQKLPPPSSLLLLPPAPGVKCSLRMPVERVSSVVRTELGVDSDPFSVRRPDFAFNILLKNSRKAS